MKHTSRVHSAGAGVGGLAVLVALMLPLAACRPAPEPEPPAVRKVRAMRVADFEGLTGRIFPGRAAATQEVDLAFLVGGPLIALPVRVGDELEAGDLVARIDPRDFEVELRNVRAQLDEANAAFALAEEQHARAKEAFERGGVSPIELARLREAENKARANVDALAASVQAAQDALDDTELVAPFAGTIVARHVENFQQVRRGLMIARLLDTSRVEMEVNIPETLISLIPYVRDVRVRFDAFPDVEVTAEVHEIGTEASTTTRTFPVTLIMDQPEGITILSGMAGRASGTARPTRDEHVDIVIPVAAVFSTGDDDSAVWIIDEASRTVRRRALELGPLTSAGYVVDAGLEPGEVIATAGVHFLEEGLEVVPNVE